MEQVVELEDLEHNFQDKINYTWNSIQLQLVLEEQ
jgi:hypothetical protein